MISKRLCVYTGVSRSSLEELNARIVDVSGVTDQMLENTTWRLALVKLNRVKSCGIVLHFKQ